jgi:hypothetical protein
LSRSDCRIPATLSQIKSDLTAAVVFGKVGKGWLTEINGGFIGVFFDALACATRILGIATFGAG